VLHDQGVLLSDDSRTCSPVVTPLYKLCEPGKQMNLHIAGGAPL